MNNRPFQTVEPEKMTRKKKIAVPFQQKKKLFGRLTSGHFPHHGSLLFLALLTHSNVSKIKFSSIWLFNDLTRTPTG